MKYCDIFERIFLFLIIFVYFCLGLPEPPLDIQVEPGPQDGTLLVTWLPVTINNRGTSNGAPVTGYAVYAGERKISEIDSPTGIYAYISKI